MNFVVVIFSPVSLDDECFLFEVEQSISDWFHSEVGLDFYDGFHFGVVNYFAVHTSEVAFKGLSIFDIEPIVASFVCF